MQDDYRLEEAFSTSGLEMGLGLQKHEGPALRFRQAWRDSDLERQ